MSLSRQGSYCPTCLHYNEGPLLDRSILLEKPAMEPETDVQIKLEPKSPKCTPYYIPDDGIMHGRLTEWDPQASASDYSAIPQPQQKLLAKDSAILPPLPGQATITGSVPTKDLDILQQYYTQIDQANAAVAYDRNLRPGDHDAEVTQSSPEKPLPWSPSPPRKPAADKRTGPLNSLGEEANLHTSRNGDGDLNTLSVKKSSDALLSSKLPAKAEIVVLSDYESEPSSSSSGSEAGAPRFKIREDAAEERNLKEDIFTQPTDTRRSGPEGCFVGQALGSRRNSRDVQSEQISKQDTTLGKPNEIKTPSDAVSERREDACEVFPKDATGMNGDDQDDHESGSYVASDGETYIRVPSRFLPRTGPLPPSPTTEPNHDESADGYASSEPSEEPEMTVEAPARLARKRRGHKSTAGQSPKPFEQHQTASVVQVDRTPFPAVKIGQQRAAQDTTDVTVIPASMTSAVAASQHHDSESQKQNATGSRRTSNTSSALSPAGSLKRKGDHDPEDTRAGKRFRDSERPSSGLSNAASPESTAWQAAVEQARSNSPQKAVQPQQGHPPSSALPEDETPLVGALPAGTPLAGTPPAGTPPVDTAPAGTPPAGTPPSRAGSAKRKLDTKEMDRSAPGSAKKLKKASNKSNTDILQRFGSPTPDMPDPAIAIRRERAQFMRAQKEVREREAREKQAQPFADLLPSCKQSSPAPEVPPSPSIVPKNTSRDKDDNGQPEVSNGPAVQYPAAATLPRDSNTCESPLPVSKAIDVDAINALYARFCEAYPAYTAPEEQFLARCLKLREEAKAELHKALWDDFTAMYHLKYLPYLQEHALKGLEFLPYRAWYNEEVDDVTHRKRVITPDILMEVFAPLMAQDEAIIKQHVAPDKATAPVETPSKQTTQSRAAKNATCGGGETTSDAKASKKSLSSNILDKGKGKAASPRVTVAAGGGHVRAPGATPNRALPWDRPEKAAPVATPKSTESSTRNFFRDFRRRAEEIMRKEQGGGSTRKVQL